MCVPEVRAGFTNFYILIENFEFPEFLTSCLIDIDIDNEFNGNPVYRYLYIVPSDLDKCGFNTYINIYDELLNKLDGMLENPDLNAVKDKITGYEIQFLLEKAAKLNNNDKTNEAIKIYEELYPDSIIAIKKLGEIYESLGYLNEAKDILEYGEANIKDFKDTYEIKDYVLKSKIYFNLGENYYDNALLALNIAINKIEKDFYETNLYEISSSSFENLIRNDVITQYKILNFECYSSYRDFIAPKKTNAEAYYYRGRIYYAQGSCNKAKQDFETAYKIYRYGEQETWVNVTCK
jgi:tetratricopeptide (TPR) repeat protein